MSKKLPLILICFWAISFMSTNAFALQSGGVEIGELETGSVVGQPFKRLEVDVELTALCVGGQKAWYPPMSVLDLRPQGTGARPGRPVLIRVTNQLHLPQGLSFSADSPFAGPTSLSVGLIVKPGESKYIGIPISDLTYITVNQVVDYISHTDSRMLGGQLLILR